MLNTSIVTLAIKLSSMMLSASLVREPVMVPADEPVMVPVLEPVIVPTADPVIVPTLFVLEPVMVPANETVVSESINVAATRVVLRLFICLSPGGLNCLLGRGDGES